MKTVAPTTPCRSLSGAKTKLIQKQCAWAALVAMANAGLASAQTSQWVRQGQDDQLVYQMDSRGNRVMNFTQTGYQGGAAIPDPNTLFSGSNSRIINVSAPTNGADARSLIQNAINQVSSFSLQSNGYRGIVRLSDGLYNISNTLNIKASGVILQGGGDSFDLTRGTILKSTSRNQIDLIRVTNSSDSKTLRGSGTTANIIDKVVPAGATSFRVDNPSAFSVGTWVNVRRDPNQAWLNHMMSAYPNDNSGDNHDWNTGEDRYDHNQERVITRIEGNRVFVNAPIAHSIEKKWSKGTIRRYDDTRIQNVGIQGIRGETVFDASKTATISGIQTFTDENHADTFIRLGAVKDAWVQNVTSKYMKGSTVATNGTTRSVTVEDARHLEPASKVDGGRRYAFNVNGGAYILMKDLTADKARRAFINNSTFNGFNRGPNVFLNSTATNSFVHSGPHARYSTGALYDVISDDNGVEARRASSPIVHGWRGGNTVFWNVDTPDYQVTNPPDSRNYVIGGTGGQTRNSGTNDSTDQLINFNDADNPLNSLYVQQRLEIERNPTVETREYWVGDFDQFEYDGAISDDAVFVDPDWQDALSSQGGYIGTLPLGNFDQNEINRRLAFSMGYELADDEAVVGAVLSIATKRLGSHSDNDRVWLDGLSNDHVVSFGSQEDWGMMFEDDLQVLQIEFLGASLSYLQDGLLNVLVGDDRPVDWAHLVLKVETDPSLVPEPGALGLLGIGLGIATHRRRRID